MESVTVYDLCQDQPYKKLLRLQQRLSALRIEGRIGNTLLLLEHSPVITIGRTPGAKAHLLVEPDALERQGIDVCETNRGGDITYHGPGQCVAYFILALVARDIHRFVRQLEQSVIALLAQHDIPGQRDPAYPGVWVAAEKICAVGLAVRKWVTMHGIALNVRPNLAHFELIVPCGIAHKGVTSMQKIYRATQRPDQVTMAQIKQSYIKSFAQTFQVETTTGDPRQVWQYLEENR
jgi:lipoyl(octanoyl) transferase